MGEIGDSPNWRSIILISESRSRLLLDSSDSDSDCPSMSSRRCHRHRGWDVISKPKGNGDSHQYPNPRRDLGNGYGLGFRAHRQEKEQSLSSKSLKKRTGKRHLVNGIGSKLLRPMGSRGGGLGEDGQGIPAPIEAKSLTKGRGLRFNDHMEAKLPSLDEEEPGTSKENRRSKKLVESKYLTDEGHLLKKQESAQYERSPSSCFFKS